MPTKSYTVTCTKNELIARDVYEVVLSKPEGFTFKAGQFVLFDVPLLENASDIQTRAFSIASAPSEDELLFVIKLKKGGRASQWVEESLKPGDTVRIQGPFGLFTLSDQQEKDYLFICTSTGIAPFRSQLTELLAAGFSRRIDMVFGVYAEEDIFWMEFFQDLSAKYENFHVHLTLSNPSTEWKGHTGWVQKLIPSVVDGGQKKIYVCGNPAMTADIKKLCLEQWGIQKTDFHMEGYI